MSSWFPALRARRRRRLAALPFPEAWEDILARNFPLAARLSAEDGAELRRKMRIFLHEKRFEGLGGLVLTDEVRVTIAAHACLLLLRLGDDVYPRLSSILVYPHTYEAPMVVRSPDGVLTEGRQRRAGEAWGLGAVVLAWDDVQRGAADVRDGANVVLHEFAHQLDMEDGVADGAPVLPRRGMYVAWARVLGAEYARLREDVRRSQRTVMDRYGATDPAEFFAVATETFFEKPRRLRSRHPGLYEQLKTFYGQDPANLPGRAG